MLYVKRNDTGEVVTVRKYIIDDNGEESIWSNEWYGRHVIGRDCEWGNTLSREKVHSLAGHIIANGVQREKIDVVEMADDIADVLCSLTVPEMSEPNRCHKCGKPVGNDVFTVCDKCWDFFPDIVPPNKEEE